MYVHELRNPINIEGDKVKKLSQKPEIPNYIFNSHEKLEKQNSRQTKTISLTLHYCLPILVKMTCIYRYS